MTADPAELLAARTLMAFTLGSHIILVPLGVSFPVFVLIANYIGLKRNDPAGLLLAQRWSQVIAVLFAVGVVSGTVLSFEMGLLWPGLTGIYGDVFGLPISMEGIFFFLEAIFITIYLYGWKHLSPWAHFWSGVVLPFAALGGVFSIISANSWMNAPAGFTLGADGRPTNLDPIAAIFNSAVKYEFPHMLAAAYMTAGFLVAWFYRCAAIAGLISVFCLECGWIVTEVGRQPWIVYNFMRTADSVTTAGMVRPFFAVAVVVYVVVAVVTVLVLREMSRRWAAGDVLAPGVPYGPVGVPSSVAMPPPPAVPTGSREV
jgi:cytochrome bd-type quinol oxidase subunit 1